MNCRSLAKIMPELAAGELSESVDAEAMEHVKDCQGCYAKLEHYQALLSALSKPRDQMEAPESLSFFTIPVKQSRRWVPSKRILALAASVVFIIVAVALARLPHTPRQQTAVKPQIQRIQAPIKKHMIDENQVAESVQKNADSNINPMPQNKKKPVNKVRYAYKQKMEQRKPVNEPEIVVKTPPEPEQSPKPMMVIAMAMPPEPPTVMAESINVETGQYTQYYAVDDEYGHQVIEIKSYPNYRIRSSEL